MIRNHNWYNLNSTRHYPLDDNATGETDDGLQLPNNILLDCHVRYPEIVGRYLYISSVSTTDNLVTLTLLASDTTSSAFPTIASTSTFVPVAAITLKKPIDQYVHYALSPMYPGVGGWVVFGPGIDEVFSGKFATPDQTLLSPKSARNYRALPVSSIQKMDTNTALTGVVQIESSQTVEVVKATRTILGAERDVLVVRLSDLFDRNLLKLMRGSCGDRPESNTCSPPGIELINSVTPDCLGNLNINFIGHGHATSYSGGAGGLIINTALGLGDSCQPNAIPDGDGALPNDFDDICESSSSSEDVTDSSETLPPADDDPPDDPCTTTLPYCASFDDSVAADFVIKRGQFVFFGDDSPDEPCGLTQGNPPTPIIQSYQANSTSDYNIALWDNCSLVDPIYGAAEVRNKKFETTIKMTAGDGNGGIVINYLVSFTTGNPQFLALFIDLHAGQLQLRRFAGQAFSPSPLHAVAVPGMGADDWLKLSVAVVPSPLDPTGKSRLACSVTGVTDPTVTGAFTVDTDVINETSAYGMYGLCSDFSVCRFSYFTLAEYY
jgi:hypothetical protein